MHMNKCVPVFCNSNFLPAEEDKEMQLCFALNDVE